MVSTAPFFVPPGMQRPFVFTLSARASVRSIHYFCSGEIQDITRIGEGDHLAGESVSTRCPRRSRGNRIDADS